MADVAFLVEPDLEGGFVAGALGHAIVAPAEREDEPREMVRDAVLAA